MSDLSSAPPPPAARDDHVRGPLDGALVVEYADFDVDRFEADRRSHEVLARVKRDFDSGLRAGVVTTPTLFIDGGRHAGLPEPDLLARLAAMA